METTPMSDRLAKLAASVRQVIARRGHPVAVEADSWTFAMDPAGDGSGPTMVRVHDDGWVEMLWSETGSRMMVDAVADPDWAKVIERRLAFGGVMPETVDADFGLRNPLTAAPRSG